MFLTPALATIVFFVGILIGGIGIGGVLLLPSLKYLGGIPLHDAIPACMLSYSVTGVVGTLIFSRHGTINWSLALKVCIGALPGAYIGAFLLPLFSSQVIETCIAFLIIYSGIDALLKRGSVTNSSQIGSSNSLIYIGLIAAIGSSLTGTGGPLLLIPILIWYGVSVLTAIGLSQVIQVPISLMATVGNIIHVHVDLTMGLVLALCLGVGAIVGARIVHLLPATKLKKGVALLLIIVGMMLLYNIISAGYIEISDI
ncbi:MAG: sulfite exporter TauE/SafE family protein [Candidatus Thiodiazotropha sp. (ex Lucinoma borealis)]|nr:sulfite exporter TauE/SafE family protein [Candidatus Thiodiazotropha sp. (ex Lucinoma borealis)]